MRFQIGRLVMTRGIAHEIAASEGFGIFVTESLHRYLDCDWGDTCTEDKALNDESVINGEGDILAVYKKDGRTIWFKTEWDHSYTTVLFPEEY